MRLPVKKILLVVLVIVAVFFQKRAEAQHVMSPRNKRFSDRFEVYYLKQDSALHTTFSPQVIDRKFWFAYRDFDNERSHRKASDKLLFRKFRKESLIEVQKKDFYIGADVLFNFQAGRDLAVDSVRNLSTNTRGVRVYGNIGKKVYFETSFLENQSYFPDFLSNSIDQAGVVPGQGAPKDFKETGYDYAYATGFFNVQLNKHFNFQFGHDKLFVGDGYRSLLLSDNAFNYPFLKATTTLWKGRIQYHTTWAQLQTLERTPKTGENSAIFKRKAGTFHFLSFSPVKQIEVGLFEGITWQRWQDGEGSRDFDYNFINPVIYSNSLAKQDDNDISAVFGTTLRLLPVEKVKVYGQYTNNYEGEDGFQLGFKTYDLLINDLTFQVEYNQLDEGFSHYSQTLSSYSHYNESLAHPAGDGFEELLAGINYRYRDVFLNLRYIARLEDKGSFDPYAIDLRLGYLINPVSNFNVYVGMFRRDYNSSETEWIYFGIKTSLTNYYYDF